MKPIYKLLPKSFSTPLIMGILNVTPDSFSDGGNYVDLDRAVEHALKMIDDGADIIDIGGESTRPGSKPVGLEEELRRVLPVQKAILDAAPDAILSIDTYRAEVARRAINEGAALINDISAATFEPEILDVVAKTHTPIVLMHIQKTPETMQANPTYTDVVTEVQEWLEKRIDAAIDAGCEERQIIVDPGIGFGKTLEHNLQLLSAIDRLTELDLPVLLGVSRKSFFQKLLKNQDLTVPTDRDLATAIITALTVQRGVSIFRVHNVQATRQAISITNALRSIDYS